LEKFGATLGIEHLIPSKTIVTGTGEKPDIPKFGDGKYNLLKTNGFEDFVLLT
jgi:hypothetical protein